MKYAILSLALLASPAQAQERPPLPVMALYSGFAFSVGADLGNTLRLRATDPAFRELNPLMRPVIEAGALPTVAVSIAGAAGLLWLSEYLRKQPETRHVWWVPVAVGTAGHVFAAFLLRPR